MKTYKTVAANAEEELTDILGFEAQYYKPGLLDDHDISLIRLDTTYDEALLLLFEKVVVRPAFNIDENKIYYPCLFFKVDGNIEQFIQKCHRWKNDHVKTTLMYSGFHMIDRAPSNRAQQVAQSLIGDSLDSGSLGDLDYLSSVKKRRVIKAYQMVKDWLAEHKIDTSESDLLAALLIDNKQIIDAYHYNEPATTPPKCIINDSQKKSLNKFAASRLLFMHALGFDVVVASKNQYASIENVIPRDFYNLFKAPMTASEQNSGSESFTKYKWLIVLTVLAIIIGIMWRWLF